VYDFASYTFDISWSNMLQALGSGACLCIPSEADRKNDIAGSFNALRANMVDLPPSISRTLSAESMPGLKTLIFGGEAVRKEDVMRWTGGDRRLIVAYGPAETTPTSTVAEFSADTSPYNIGFCVGCCSWVVDPISEELTLVGGVGELWTEGPIVCAGYLEEPDKTAAVFVEDPPWLLRGDGAGQHGRRGRLYKTGDLVRSNPDGSLDFISRKDDQIKIRGQRIELTEIEQTIELCLPIGSRAGQVLVEKIVPKGSRNPMLAAFFPLGSVAVNGPTSDAVKAMQDLADGLEEKLTELLPGYMLPGAYIPVHRIPVTTSGKKDRKKLREIGSCLSLEQLSRMHIVRRKGRQPTTDIEKQFQKLFAQVLGVNAEAVSADDSFFRI
jgi:acyl-CoA synthetase (AMP-forming)/AMP-acid ligase II